jgi:bis(5'-nucleosyl)-tetraphosphatase (symmetrical)
VQGCDRELGELLKRINFCADRDRLWFVGDLVNRGPASLGVLRRVHALGDTAVVTLGNHDLHLLACAFAPKPRHKGGDTLDEVLKAKDRDRLLEWLLNRPLMHEDASLGWTMVHAGLAPQWNLETARACAREIEAALRNTPRTLLAQIYGNEPDMWDANLRGSARARYIINCFTRLRCVHPDGRLDLANKGLPPKDRSKSIAWFEAPGAEWRGAKLIFGHWSTLGYSRKNGATCLDTGCVWGGQLTALRLDADDAEPICVPCARYQEPDG